MKIKWFGQSCFMITSENGTKVLTDPFKKMVGYKLPEIEANIVSTSHEHGDHNNINAVKSSFVHINELGEFSEDGIEIKGVETFHDKFISASGLKAKEYEELELNKADIKNYSGIVVLKYD